jgi:hypothetical protein
MTEDRKTIDVEVFSTGSDEWSLSDFLNELTENVPEVARETARVELESGGDYCTLRVTFKRPETDEEMRCRIERDNERKRRSEDQERRDYEKLRLKFEKQS